MSRVRAFFLEEAGECLVRLKAAPAGPGSVVDLHAAARRLRGSAQLARYAPVVRIAQGLERRLKALARGELEWTSEVAAQLESDLMELEEAVRAVRDGRTQREPTEDRRMERPAQSAETEVAIEELEYRGTAALTRALELRTAIEDAIVEGEGVGPVLDELFDLIRLGME